MWRGGGRVGGRCAFSGLLQFCPGSLRLAALWTLLPERVTAFAPAVEVLILQSTSALWFH